MVTVCCRFAVARSRAGVQPAQVLLRGGVYYLAAPLVLTGQDEGLAVPRLVASPGFPFLE